MHDAYDDLALHRDASVRINAYIGVYMFTKTCSTKQSGAGEYKAQSKQYVPTRQKFLAPLHPT